VLAEKAVRLAPENGMVLDTYGWILFKQGRNGEAIVKLREALAALPDHPIVLYHLGAAYLAAGNDDLGRDHVVRALARAPDFIMEPETYYETFGTFIPNVIFPTGNVVKDGLLWIYYGCCDTSIGLATVPLNELIDHIFTTGTSK